VGLLIFTTFCRVLEEFVKLPRAFPSQGFVVFTFVAENPASPKYDTAKEVTTRSVFFAKAGYSSFNEIQKFVGFPE